jgi:hypothetical protein
MEKFRFRIRYSGPIAAIRNRRTWNREIEEPSWRDPGILWVQSFRPKHFTVAGAAEYGYAPRKGEESGLSRKQFWNSYTGRKIRYRKHRRPLVWSGEMERQSRRAEIRTTSKGVRIIMRVRKANWRHPNSRVRMADELRRVSVQEGRAMVKEKEKGLVRQLRQCKTRAEVTIQT